MNVGPGPAHPAPLLLVLAFRWLALLWMVTVALLAGEIQRPGLAAAALSATLVWTAWLTAASSRRPIGVLAVDLTLAATLLVTSGLVHPPQSVLTGHPSFAGAYPMVAVAAWAAVYHVRGGLFAGAVLCVTLPFTYAANGVPLNSLSHLQELSLAAGLLAYLLLGAVGGAVAGQFETLVDSTARIRERAAGLAERLRLAARIHDETIQHLARIQRRGRELADRGAVTPADLRALMADLRRQETALRDLADPTGDPPPDPVAAASLNRAVSEALGDYHSLPVHLVTGTDVWLPERATAEVVAALREVLSNTAEHATATQVWCTILSEKDGVRIHVRDDGTGFTVDEASLVASGRLGLRISVRDRITRLGGHVHIHSRPGRGTRIELWLPASLVRRP